MYERGWGPPKDTKVSRSQILQAPHSKLNRTLFTENRESPSMAFKHRNDRVRANDRVAV